MSNKNQGSQRLSTEENLELFTERSEVLSRYFSENFHNESFRTVIEKIGISRNTNIEGDEWKFHTLTYGLICLIRPFFLPSEPIVLYPIKQDIQKQRRLQPTPTDVPLLKLSNEPRWYEAVDQAVEAINQLFYGIGTPLDAEPQKLEYTYNGKRITRLEEFSTIIYGEIIHFNIEKHRTYKQWKKAPGDLFSSVTIQVPFLRRPQRPLKKKGMVRGHLALRPGDCVPLHPLLKSYFQAYYLIS
jgi:hypothetical protein